MTRFARPILNFLILAGLLLAVWPLGQTVYGLWNQRTLAAQWRAEQPSRGSRAAAEKKQAESAALPLLAAPKKPRRWPLTKLSIPDIGLETFVVQGMDAASLRRGPGHDPNSALPGEGNCVISGHRNVYGSFFYRLDELMAGALITLETPHEKFAYRVQSVYPTPETNLTILQPPPASAPPVLTLVTCTLPHTSNRVVVTAWLETDAP